MGISQSDYQTMLSRLERQNRARPDIQRLEKQVDQECDLQMEIIEFLKAKGWYYEWSPMHQASSLPAGSPDFRIAAPGGVTFWVECKSRTGKVRPDQMAAACMLTHLGHRHAVVRSMREFLDFVNSTKPCS